MVSCTLYSFVDELCVCVRVFAGVFQERRVLQVRQVDTSVESSSTYSYTEHSSDMSSEVRVLYPKKGPDVHS